MNGILRHDTSSGLPSGLDLSTTLAAMPAVVWTTDLQLRMTGSMGGGLPALGLPSDGVEGMPLAEFFQDVRPDSKLIQSHRRALAGETASCALPSLRGWFRGVLQPLREDGEVVGVVGLAVEEIPPVPMASRLILTDDGVRLDLSDAETEETGYPRR